MIIFEKFFWSPGLLQTLLLIIHGPVMEVFKNISVMISQLSIGSSLDGLSRVTDMTGRENFNLSASCLLLFRLHFDLSLLSFYRFVLRCWGLRTDRVWPVKVKVKSSMAYSLPVQNLLPQNMDSIMNYLQ